MRKKPTKPKSGPAVVMQRRVSLLAGKWEREGREMLRLAETEPSVEGDMALRNAGAARLKCAKELRAKMRKQANDQAEARRE